MSCPLSYKLYPCIILFSFIFYSCKTTRPPVYSTSNVADNNNHIIVHSNNTINRSTGSGKVNFEGKNNIIEITVDSSCYAAKNSNGVLIVKGDQNNMIVKQKKVIDLSENRADTTIIVSNKQKYEFSGENITDRSKNTSSKNIIARQSSDDDLNITTIKKNADTENADIEFLSLSLEEGTMDLIGSNENVYVEETNSMMKVKDALALHISQIKKGNIKGYYRIGNFYHKGIGTKVNSLKTEELYEIAARKGLSEAQYELGYIYEVGFWNVKANKEKAVYYYKMAAEQGNENAIERLAEITQ